MIGKRHAEKTLDHSTRVNGPLSHWAAAIGFTLLAAMGLMLAGGSAAQAQPPEFLWATKASGSEIDEGLDVAVDGSGHVLVTGRFQNNVTFNGIDLISAGGDDIFVAKYAPDGDLLWAKRAGSSVDTSGKDDIGLGIAVDDSDNVFVTGQFFGAASFDGTDLTGAGNGDIFVAKYSPSGNLLWAKGAGGSSDDQGYDIAVDDSGNALVTGSFSGTASFDGIDLTAAGTDIFVAKYDPSGDVLWAEQAGGAGGIELHVGTDITVDSSGNPLITGYFRGTASFNGTSITSAGIRDIFVAKYDSDGNLLWAERAGGADSDEGEGIAVDDSGNVFVTGEFRGTGSFDGTDLNSAGNRDIFVAKYDPSGSLLWVKRAGSSDSDRGIDVALDGSGNALVTGSFVGTVNFGDTELSATFDDIFTVKYASDGNVVWAKRAGGFSSESGHGIATDGSGNALVTGWFVDEANFDDIELSSAGFDADIFVAKLGLLEEEETVGGDPPLWGDYLIFPTPETFLGQDLNGDADSRDAVLRIKNVRTGRVRNTGIPVSNHHRAVDLYKDTAVFVTQESSLQNGGGLFNLWGTLRTDEGPIGVLDVETGEVRMLDVWGTRPTIYEDIVTISDATVRYYDLSRDRLVDTGQPGTRPAVWGDWIVCEREVDSVPHLHLHNLETGGTQNTGVAGAYPAIHRGTVAFTTAESWVGRDLNGDDDRDDTVVRAYDIADDRVIDIGQAGQDPAIYGDRIAFSQGRAIVYHDLATGRTYATGQQGAEPDIYQNTVTSYVWEDWLGTDLNADRDRDDPIVQTHTASDADRVLQQPQLTPAPQPTPLTVARVFSHRQANGVRVAVQGQGIERVELTVFDLSGQRLAHERANDSQLTWRLSTDQGRRVANGVYLYVVTVRGADGQVTRSDVRKLVVLR